MARRAFGHAMATLNLKEVANMHENRMAGTNVSCALQSCKYHLANDTCRRESIHIGSCCHCGTGKPEDETMCADYCCRG